MTQAQKFLFGRNFRDGLRAAEAGAAGKGEEAGYARGLADGRRLAEAAAGARLAEAMARLAGLAETLLAREAERAALAERDAGALALAFARKIAGDALARFPAAALEEAARQCFRHLRGVPHLAVRINEALVEEAGAVVRDAAHREGFDGKLVVLGDPELAPGDVRLEWADGGIVRDRKTVEDAVAEAIDRVLGLPDTPHDGDE